MEDICVLKEKYDKGEIKQEELTKDQRIQRKWEDNNASCKNR